MAVTDVLKEYLVKVGFDVDNTTQRKVNDALKDINTSLNTLSRNKSFKILAGTATSFASVLTTVVTSTAMLMKKTADADMEYQKIALRMHMTTQAAKQMTIAMEALGATFEEIAWNPELLARYQELHKLVGQAATPADASTQLRLIRDVGFEFTKLMTTMRAATEWITYHLAKMFGGEIKKIRDWLRNINKWLLENLPKWTEKIATFLGRFINIAKVLWDVLKGIFGVIKDTTDALPKIATGIMAVGAAFVFLSMHPALMALRPIILGLIALFLLLDDYATFKRARDAGEDSWTMFAPLWEVIDDMLPKLNKSLGQLTTNIGKLLNPGGQNLGFWTIFSWLIEKIAKGFALVIFGLQMVGHFMGHLTNPEIMEAAKPYDEKIAELKEKRKLATTHKERKAIDKEILQTARERNKKVAEARSESRWKYIDLAYQDFKVFKDKFGSDEDLKKAKKDLERQLKFVEEAMKSNHPAQAPAQAPAPGPTSFLGQPSTDTYVVNIENLNLPGVSDTTNFLKNIVMVAQEQRAVS